MSQSSSPAPAPGSDAGRAGAMALSWTMDKIGPMCRAVEDCALVLDAIHGADRSRTDQQTFLSVFCSASLHIRWLRHRARSARRCLGRKLDTFGSKSPFQDI